VFGRRLGAHWCAVLGFRGDAWLSGFYRKMARSGADRDAYLTAPQRRSRWLMNSLNYLAQFMTSAVALVSALVALLSVYFSYRPPPQPVPADGLQPADGCLLRHQRGDVDPVHPRAEHSRRQQPSHSVERHAVPPAPRPSRGARAVHGHGQPLTDRAAVEGQ